MDEAKLRAAGAVDGTEALVSAWGKLSAALLLGAATGGAQSHEGALERMKATLDGLPAYAVLTELSSDEVDLATMCAIYATDAVKILLGAMPRSRGYQLLPEAPR
jgi:hypothetical protein